jgi:hypothetical protein
LWTKSGSRMLLGFNKHTFMSCCIVSWVKVAALLRTFEFLIHFGVDFGDACWMELFRVCRASRL